MSDRNNGQPFVVHQPSDIEQYAAWLLSMAVAIAVFFQVHVSFPAGLINVFFYFITGRFVGTGLAGRILAPA